MNLKQMANKYVSGGVTWYLMPYSTLSFQSTREQFNKYRPVATWTDAEYSFVWIESYVVDLDFAPELTEIEQRFATYWNDRPAPISDRWKVFSFLVDADIAQTFWLAFAATRNTAIESVEPIAEGELPNS